MMATSALAKRVVLWQCFVVCWLSLCSFASTAKSIVWIALSESSAAHSEVARTIRANVDKGVPTQIEWVVEPWSALEARVPEPGVTPRLVIAIGARAWSGVVQRFASKDSSASTGDSTPALFATLLPRTAFETGLSQHHPEPRPGSVSAVFLGQPLARQARLLRLAFPSAKHVGLLLGPESRQSAAEIRNALAQESFVADFDECVECPVSKQLQLVLERSDLVLAVPDQQIFNSSTIAGILGAGYRRRIPLVGFSPAYVKAGAALALYSTPEQQGIASAELISRFLSNGQLPSARPPSLFTVGVNPDVARAFGLALDEKQLETQLRREAR
jgi:putative tryptophan/tyrosine transport system substrate-binding protein